MILSSLHYLALFATFFLSAAVAVSPLTALGIATFLCVAIVVLNSVKAIDSSMSTGRLTAALIAALCAGLLYKHHIDNAPPDLISLVVLLLLLSGAMYWLASAVQNQVSLLWSRLQGYSVPALIVLVLCIGGSLWILQAFKYASFTTHLWDLGCFAQAFGNTLNGNFFQVTHNFTDRNICIFASHSEFIFCLLLPLFALFPHPLTLPAIQAVFIMAALLLMYRLALHVQCSKAAAFVFAVSFCLYPPLYLAGLFDFHGETLALPFLILLIISCLRKQHRMALVWLVLALSCKEYIALVTVMWGLYCLIRHKRYRLGGTIIVLSCLWFVGALLMQNALRPPDISSQFAVNYKHLGGSTTGAILSAIAAEPVSVVRHLFKPETVSNILLLVFPTLGLCLVYPWTIALCGLNLLKDMLTVSMSIDSHRLVPVVPFLWYGTILGFKRVFLKQGSTVLRQTILIMVLVCATISSFLYSEAPWSQRFFRSINTKYRLHAGDRALARYLQTIPRSAVVCVSPAIYPQLFRHPLIYQFPYIGDTRLAEWIVLCAPDKLDTLLTTGADRHYRLVWQVLPYSVFVQDSAAVNTANSDHTMPNVKDQQ